MSRQVLFLAVIGLGGLAILLSLGVWQMQRLAWKEALLSEIAAQLDAPPVALPDRPAPDAHRYLPVEVTGRFAADAPRARMLASRRQTGAVHRHVAVFASDSAGPILVDIGWTEDDVTPPPLSDGTLTLVGNLDWPREVDGFTPDPEGDLWFARDVPAMAAAYDTAPVLMVLREMPQTDLGTTPWPVDTSGIPNDHLQYAITWFSLAAVWVGMMFLFLRRARNRKA